MIHRREVDVDCAFLAPTKVTFGFQKQRDELSIWYEAGAPNDTTYVVLGTGHSYHLPIEIVSSCVLDDGFHVFHLCRVGEPTDA